MVSKLVLFIAVLALLGVAYFGYLQLSHATPTPGKPSVSPTPKPTAKPTAVATVSVTPVPSPTVQPSPTPKPPVITDALAVPALNYTNFTWKSSVAGPSVLEYGESRELGNNVSADDNTTVHRLNVSRLSFKTTYYYRVGTCLQGSCGYSAIASFTTPHKPCPEGMRYFDEGDFCMDGFEAAQDPITRLAQSSGGKSPWVFIGRSAAATACDAVGKRLCTSKEFSTACNIDGKTFGPIGSSCQISAFKSNETGETACTSREGVHDLIGNVAEWVSDSVTEMTPSASGFVDSEKDPLSLGVQYAFPKSSSSTTDKYGNDYYRNFGSGNGVTLGAGILRGGDYKNGPQAGCFAYTINVPLDTANEAIGFRCCQ